MVGVPGRSKGCNTCIQRKVKCDQGTPLCANCKKANRLCTGYKRRLGYVFVSEMNLVDQPQGSQDQQIPTVTHQGRWRKTTPRQAPLALYQHAEPIEMALSRQICTQAAMRQQFQHLFHTKHFPADMLGSQTANAHDWMFQVQEAGIQSPALEMSLSSFLSARVARMNGDARRLYESRSMYTASLDLLREALRKPQTRLLDETLAACVAVSLYELSESPLGPSAYTSHQRGAMALLEARGPDASSSSLGHALFLHLRSQAVTRALLFRRETFLGLPEWLQQPWQSLPKSPQDALLDTLCTMPVYFRQLDNIGTLRPSRPPTPEVIHGVIQACLMAEAALQDIYERFEQSISGPLYWPELSSLKGGVDDAEAGQVFPISFYFPVFSVAQIVCTYWSATMVVHNQLMNCYDKLAVVQPSLTHGPDGATSAQRSQEHRDKWMTVTRNLCQTAEYFMQDRMGGFGRVTLLVHLTGCRAVLVDCDREGCSREISWITALIFRIQRSFDFPVSKILEE